MVKLIYEFTTDRKQDIVTRCEHAVYTLDKMDLRLDEATWNKIITNFEKKLEDEIEISVKMMRVDNTKKKSESMTRTRKVRL